METGQPIIRVAFRKWNLQSEGFPSHFPTWNYTPGSPLTKSGIDKNIWACSWGPAEEEEREKKEERPADIKSKNPHLTGGNYRLRTQWISHRESKKKSSADQG